MTDSQAAEITLSLSAEALDALEEICALRRDIVPEGEKDSVTHSAIVIEAILNLKGQICF